MAWRRQQILRKKKQVSQEEYDKDGALLVETKDGIKSIVSGEVSVRGLYGYV